VQKQGKASTARQALTHQELIHMLDPLKAADQDIFHQRGMPSSFVVQHVLIARVDARVDDTSQFLAENSTATKCKGGQQRCGQFSADAVF
jgi:hypothetical protein